MTQSHAMSIRLLKIKNPSVEMGFLILRRNCTKLLRSLRSKLSFDTLDIN